MKQQYENYWKLTLEYSNINGDNFIQTLQAIVDFIDDNRTYEELQNFLFQKFPKVDKASTRKSINQFVKLGFINTGLKSYHLLTKDFLSCDNNDRRSLFSKIVYENASFNRSVKNESNQKEINFLVRTLEEIKIMDSDDIASLMTIADLNEYQNGYITRTELDFLKQSMHENGFLDRKYNQLSYTLNVLTRLDNIIKTNDGKFTLSQYTDGILSDTEEYISKRDPYLHRMYKTELINESNKHFGNTVCMLEYLKYPSLVASHIKPFIQSNSHEAYDKYNGLLLSRNLDALFDKGYISFNDNGEIMQSKYLDVRLQKYLLQFKLNDFLLHTKRLEYLKYHRQNIFKENKGE